jgi:RHS repeat-associated protein
LISKKILTGGLRGLALLLRCHFGCADKRFGPGAVDIAHLPLPGCTARSKSDHSKNPTLIRIIHIRRLEWQTEPATSIPDKAACPKQQKSKNLAVLLVGSHGLKVQALSLANRTLHGAQSMPTSLNETILCRYNYDPLDRLADCTPLEQAGVQRYYCKNRLTTEIQGTVRYSFLQHDDQLLAQQQSQGSKVDTALLATDQQRSVFSALDTAQHHSLVYSPYGHRQPESGLVSLLGFTGQRPDPVTGQYHLGNGYRAFNPVLSRFHCPDSLSPFGRGGLNAYAYCAGDPMNRTDPTGHFWGIGTFLRRIGVMRKVAKADNVASTFAQNRLAHGTGILTMNTTPSRNLPGVTPASTMDVPSTARAAKKTWTPKKPTKAQIKQQKLIEKDIKLDNRIAKLDHVRFDEFSMTSRDPDFDMRVNRLTNEELVEQRDRLERFAQIGDPTSISRLEQTNAVLLKRLSTQVRNK